MAATDSSFPSLEENATVCSQWAGPQCDKAPDVTPVWAGTNVNDCGPEWNPAGGTASSYLCPLSQDTLTSDAAGSFANSIISQDSAGINQPAEPKTIPISSNNQDTRLENSAGAESTETKRREAIRVSRPGRAENRTSSRELWAPPPERRAKSLDRMTPDLLNFKKGWLVKLEDNEQWKKFWFVLSADSLRYYKDVAKEESSVLDGEIDLTNCYRVSDYDVPRNYGFQIHTVTDVFTLSAMTAGIRRNWIQALMKNVHPANAPDVAGLSAHRFSCSPPEILPKPDVTQDSAPTDTEARPGVKQRPCQADWTRFRPYGDSQTETPQTKPPDSPKPDDQDGRRRREERRKKFESMLGISLQPGESEEKTADSLKSRQQKAEEDVEEIWKKVEQAVIRGGRMVLLPESRNPAEELLQSYKNKVEELEVRLAERQGSDGASEQSELHLYPETDFCPSDEVETPAIDLTDSEASALFWQQTSPPLPNIVLCDEPDGLKQADVPVSDGRQDVCQTGNSALLGAAESGEEEQRKLSLEVERLSGQNEALNQRNQEMLNQLTEADREIERLKAELSRRYAEEQQEKKKTEDLQEELNRRNQELLEARSAMASLTVNLSETEEERKNEERNKTEEEEEKLEEPGEAAEENEERSGGEERSLNVSGEEKIQNVLEEMIHKMETLQKLQEGVEGLEFTDEAETETSAMIRRLRWEEKFWTFLSSCGLNEPSEDLMERRKAETQMLLAGCDLLRRTQQDMLCEATPTAEPLGCFTQERIRLLKQICSVSSSMLLALQPAAPPQDLSEPPSVAMILSAATEVLCCRRIGPDRAGPAHVNRQPVPMADASCQTESSAEETDEHVMEQILQLREQVRLLEKQVEDLLLFARQMDQDFQQRGVAVTEQHETEMEKLKLTCEHALVSMREFHRMEMEEQQRLHQQEVERLRVEKEALLEEESAATATAIAAIKRVHDEELQKEIQKRCTPDRSQPEQHREELESLQRELTGLSKQFSLKCLENKHLGQALHAERKALCQCQTENQDLRSANQELCGRLASDVSRLSLLGQQDAMQLGEETDVYDMKISLRLKESEVESLKQKIASLKEELQSALQERRDALKENKKMFAELNVFRAKVERDTEELRENLRLAHLALHRSD